MVFYKKKKSYGLLVYVGILICIIVFFMMSLQHMKTENFEQARVSLTEALRKASIHCYAIEGQYPEDLDYLQEHYGVSYDKKRFQVHYERIGANLMPDIFVTGSECLDSE